MAQNAIVTESPTSSEKVYNAQEILWNQRISDCWLARRFGSRTAADSPPKLISEEAGVETWESSANSETKLWNHKRENPEIILQ